MSLSFDDDHPMWDGSSLEAALLREAGRPVHLTLTDNRSVLLSFRRTEGIVQLRLHRMFLHATLGVVRAVARNLHRARRRSEAEVRRFMNENLYRVRKAQRPFPLLVTKGRHYDLHEMLNTLNYRFFDGTVQVPVTWGRGSGRARRGGLTFGSYDPVLRLIRIHPVLDRSDVPKCFIESVLYHEMLHHQMGGVPDGSGRTIYHSPAFREAEAQYPGYRRAIAWEKRNLPHLLKASQRLDRERRAQAALARRS